MASNSQNTTPAKEKEPVVKLSLAQYVARVSLDELAAAVLRYRRPGEKLTLEQWDAAWAVESKKE